MEANPLPFFEQSPAALPIYQAFSQQVFQQIEDVGIRVQKTQITFFNRHVFAAVSFLPVRRAKDRPKTYLVVTFGLPYRLESPRIDGAVEPYPNRWTHHVLLSSPEEADEELMSWVKEAARFASGKR